MLFDDFFQVVAVFEVRPDITAGYFRLRLVYNAWALAELVNDGFVTQLYVIALRLAVLTEVVRLAAVDPADV
jgi:hypothetical protein